MNSTPARAFGQNVYRLRNAAKLTQEALAERADISRRHLLSIEAGQKSPKLEVITRLHYGLKCTWDDLMKGVL